MKIEFDDRLFSKTRQKVWVAFATKDGRPYLAEGKSLTEASSSVYQMIEEDSRNETISRKSS